MRVVLISTYDLGHQPFGLASPAAWLRAEGHEVTVADLSRECFPEDAVRAADWIAFHLPMHTATRLAIPRIRAARALNLQARICCYGLYAPPNQEMLEGLGVTHVIGGEFEKALADLIGGRGAQAKACATSVVFDRLQFRVPDRRGLPVLNEYAALVEGGERKVAGYTEASRGCKHLCRHCPVVPIYQGRFRVVQREVVLADARQQIAAGAQHITFGDPDFLNGPGHARAIVEAFHAEFPDVTYDVTIKIEHLLTHREMLPLLKQTGCLFITSAVESLDDRVLGLLAKGHTRTDFLEALALTRTHGLTLAPTFVPFTPWTSHDDYLDLVRTIRDVGLIENVAPVQLAIRLLIPAGSRLLELEEMKVGEFDAAALSWRWEHPDPGMDQLCKDVQKIAGGRGSRTEIFARIWERAFGIREEFSADHAAIPHMTEAWYCCAEPLV